jgi:molybdopterin converting factor small subunit
MDFANRRGYSCDVPEVVLTQNLQRHVACPNMHLPGTTVREVLQALFAEYPQVRGYVLDDQGALRHHMVIFVDGRQIKDRMHLRDPVSPDSEIYIMQALSGGA